MMMSLIHRNIADAETPEYSAVPPDGDSGTPWYSEVHRSDVSVPPSTPGKEGGDGQADQGARRPV